MPLADDDRPELISDSGVSVVLLGRADEDDTTVAPPGADLPSQWVAAYLERRYFSIPANVTLKVKRPAEIYDAALDLRRSIYDTIQGQRYYLDKHSDAKNVCPLPDVGANVHWWLLSDDIVKGGKTWNNRGHVGAIYQGELYDVRDGAARVSALKDFGIYAGHGRIVIYVEPNTVLKANTPRTTLILPGNRQIDYAEIGAAFAEMMPDELAMYMAGQVSAEKGDHRKAIKKNLKEVEEAFKLVRYRRSKVGAVGNFEEDFGGVSSVGASSGASGRASTTHPQDEGTGRIGKDYLRKANEERDRLRGQRADTDPMPRIVWDETGDTVPTGRAATYTKATHVVTANARFRFFRDFVDWSFADARNRAISDIDDDTLLGMCEDEVKRWFEQALTEAVVVLRPMAHDEKWGPSVFDSGLSDEGLTAAVISHRWHMMSAIKRGMAGRLGRTRETALPNQPR